MKQYLITAYDYTDENALERRLSTRQLHLDGAGKLKEKGNFIKGGALLNELDQMIGSVLILQFEHPGDLEKWQENEPYLTHRVWEKITIQAFKVADV
jgi:uncharacterized protein YciI